MLKNKEIKLIVISGMILGLNACGINDFTLTKLGEKIDPPPRINTDVQPIADVNGIITYPDYQIVVAQENDTVSTVAARIGINAKTLARHNGLDINHLLRKGEILAIPQGSLLNTTSSIEDIATQALNDTPTNTTARTQSGDQPLRHTVSDGETAYSIAQFYGVSVNKLASWNGLGADLELQSGQRLLIPIRSQDEKQKTTPPRKTIKPKKEAKPSEPNTQEKPLPTATKPTLSESKIEFIPPVSGKIIRKFSKEPGGNEGVDIAVAKGSEVRASAKGTVALIDTGENKTNVILLRHKGQRYTVYSNLTDTTVLKGSNIDQGQIIGKVADGSPPYLHFEIRNGADPIDPTPYLR